MGSAKKQWSLVLSVIILGALPAHSGSSPKPAKPALPPYSEMVARVIALEARLDQVETKSADQDLRIGGLERRLRHFSLVDVDPLYDDALGNPEETIRISGANVQIVNGTNRTDAFTGVGNLVVGYNRFRTSGNERQGSHCLIVGDENNYVYNGVVLGFRGLSWGPYANVLGGWSNTAFGKAATAVGGAFNQASNFAAVVSGGRLNFAAGSYSTISGGDLCEITVAGESSSISGGAGNLLATPRTWMGGRLRSP